MSSASAPAGRPLEGLRVLDLTHAAAGPFASMFLGDLGAEVIKVEKPKGGDGARTMGVPMPGFGPKDSDYFLALNRNKRGVVVDLARPEGRALVCEMVPSCDVVLENFRPGVTERLGLGFEQLRGLRRGLVYASISAFGPGGPWSERPANDIIMQSVSGLMGITGEAGGGPVRIGAPIADFSSGLFMLSGVLAALFARERHPEGQHVQVAMLEASLNMMANYVPSVATLGARIGRLGRGHAQIVPYQAFLCADGEYLMIGAFTRGFWHNLCRALERDAWIADPRFVTNAARLANRAELVGLLEAIFATKPRKAWSAIMTEADVPNSPVYELHDAIRSEQVVHLGSLIEVGEGDRSVTMARSPMRVAQWGPDRVEPAPGPGRDTRAVLRDLLGRDDAAIDALAAAGVVDLGARGAD